MDSNNTSLFILNSNIQNIISNTFSSIICLKYALIFPLNKSIENRGGDQRFLKRIVNKHPSY